MYSSVSCAEELGTVSERFDLEKGLEASVTLRCAWSSKDALVQDLLLNHRVWPNASVSSCLARSASVQQAMSVGAVSGQHNIVADALVTVNYSTKQSPGATFITETFEPSVEFQTLDYKRFRWIGDAAPLLEGEAPGRQVRRFKLVRKMFELAAPLTADFITHIGAVNEDAYVSSILGLTFDPEVLLFEHPEFEKVSKSNGTEAYNVTVHMAGKPEGWNVYWRAKSQAYEVIVDVNDPLTAILNYPIEDMTSFLF
jgi:hypothetical protein